MQVIRNEQVLTVDIDDTLVCWNGPGFGRVTIDGNVVTPHSPHLKIVRDRLERGATLIVWSAGGFAWAEKVLKALEIDSPNIYVFSKPVAYIDDKPCEEWMGQRIYLNPDSHYGSTQEG